MSHLTQCPITGNLSPLFPAKGPRLCKARPTLWLPGPLFLRVILWLAIWWVFPLSVTCSALSFRLEVLGGTTPRSSGSDTTLSSGRTEGILRHLERAEKLESNPWLKDDYRIAWITVNWAQSGVPDWSWHRNSPAHVAATYQVLHCPPDEVWSRIEARRRADLGSEYALWYGESTTTQKKACASERRTTRRKEAA